MLSRLMQDVDLVLILIWLLNFMNMWVERGRFYSFSLCQCLLWLQCKHLLKQKDHWSPKLLSLGYLLGFFLTSPWCKGRFSDWNSSPERGNNASWMTKRFMNGILIKHCSKLTNHRNCVDWSDPVFWSVCIVICMILIVLRLKTLLKSLL